MKLKLYLVALLLGTFALQSCDDDDDKVKVPKTVQDAFSQKYPTTPAYDWDLERGYYVAEFRNNYSEAEAWFQADGTWVRTETDYRVALPEAVQSYINTNYPSTQGYFIDDIDWVETPTQNYFDVELDRQGMPDVHIYIQENGTLIN